MVRFKFFVKFGIILNEVKKRMLVNEMKQGVVGTRVFDEQLDTMQGIDDDQMTLLFNEAIRIENEISKAKGVPVVRYDGERQQVYLENPDGTINYVQEA